MRLIEAFVPGQLCALGFSLDSTDHSEIWLFIIYIYIIYYNLWMAVSVATGKKHTH